MDTIIQGSDEWRAIRLGKVTASRVSDVMAKVKSGPSASRSNYMAELIAERLTRTAGERFQTPAMAWGNEQESVARQRYAFDHDTEVDLVGFVPHPTISMAGASPDGLVGANGLVEIKAPNTATHIETLISGTIPGKYQIQMLWQMACDPAREWCDFVSFDPRLPPHMEKFQRRFMRDNERIAEMEREVTTFLAEMDAKIEALEAAVLREVA